MGGSANGRANSIESPQTSSQANVLVQKSGQSESDDDIARGQPKAQGCRRPANHHSRRSHLDLTSPCKRPSHSISRVGRHSKSRHSPGTHSGRHARHCRWNANGYAREAAVSGLAPLWNRPDKSSTSFVYVSFRLVATFLATTTCSTR